jgi:hypothetical protein
MKKIWYIQIGGQEEGPYSFPDLKRDPRITPDTLARKAGEAEWRPVRLIKELRDLFKEEEPFEEEQKPKVPSKMVAGQDTLALDMRYDPSNWIWVVILILAILYVLYQLHVR